MPPFLCGADEIEDSYEFTIGVPKNTPTQKITIDKFFIYYIIFIMEKQNILVYSILAPVILIPEINNPLTILIEELKRLGKPYTYRQVGFEHRTVDRARIFYFPDVHLNGTNIYYEINAGGRGLSVRAKQIQQLYHNIEIRNFNLADARKLAHGIKKLDNGDEIT